MKNARIAVDLFRNGHFSVLACAFRGRLSRGEDRDGQGVHSGVMHVERGFVSKELLIKRKIREDKSTFTVLTLGTMLIVLGCGAALFRTKKLPWQITSAALTLAWTMKSFKFLANLFNS